MLALVSLSAIVYQIIMLEFSFCCLHLVFNFLKRIVCSVRVTKYYPGLCSPWIISNLTRVLFELLVFVVLTFIKLVISVIDNDNLIPSLSSRVKNC